MSNRTIYLTVIILIICSTIIAKKTRVLIHMTETQSSYFNDSIIEPFAKSEEIKMEVVNVASIDDIPWTLKVNKGKLALVKLPFIHAWSLVDSGYIKPLDSFLPSDEVEKYK